MPVKIGLKRRQDSGKIDRLDMEDKKFHQKVRNAYLGLAKENKNDRWQIIDATKDIEQVSAAIWKQVKAKMELK